MCTFPHSWKFNTNIQYGSHFGLTIGDLWRLRWEAQQLKAVESSASKPVTMVGCAGRQKNNIERELDSDGRRRKHRANRIYMYAIFMSTIRSCRVKTNWYRLSGITLVRRFFIAGQYWPNREWTFAGAWEEICMYKKNCTRKRWANVNVFLFRRILNNVFLYHFYFHK